MWRFTFVTKCLLLLLCLLLADCAEDIPEPLTVPIPVFDTTPPMIVDHNCAPKNGATGVKPGDYPERLTIVFSEPMSEAKVTATDPEFDFTEGLTGNTLTINLMRYRMPNETRFKIMLAGKDFAGNDLATTEYSFETRKWMERELINETKKVSAGTHAAWPLFLSEGSMLHGEITCTKHDINVWLLSPREYEAFKAGEKFFPYWQASRERTVQFAFDFTIPKLGWYYFVLDNEFSWLTSKTVAIHLKAIE